MPSYAIKSSGIRQVADGKILGNNSGGVGPALELSPADLNAMGVGGNPFDQDLNTTDSPTFNIVNVSAGEGKGINFGNGDLRMYSRNANRICLAGDINESIEFHVGGEGGVNVRDEGWFGFSSNNNPDTADTYIRRDAAATLRFSNGVSPYTLNLYGTRTDASNYERLSTKFDGTRYLISAESAGTGSNREVRLKASNGSIYVNTGTYFAQIRDANNNERYDFADGYVRNRVNANLGTTSMRWGQAFLGGETVTTSTPPLDITQTWNDGAVSFKGIVADFTNTASTGSKPIEISVDGSPIFEVAASGTTTIQGNLLSDNWYNAAATGRIQLGGADSIHYQPIRMQGTADYVGWDQGGRFYPDGVGTTITQRVTTAAQSFRVANTWTDASNYELGIFDWTTTANTLTIGTEAAGTGSARGLSFSIGGTEYGALLTNGRWKFGSAANSNADVNIGGARVIEFNAGSASVRASSGQLALMSSGYSPIILTGYEIRLQGFDAGATTMSLRSAGVSTKSFVIEKLTSQTADLFQVRDVSAASEFFVIDYYGRTKFDISNAGTTAFVDIAGTHNASTGDQVAFSITPTYNQTATAGGTDLLINRTETALGSGSHYLIDAQVGAASKFSVDNSGNVTVGGDLIGVPTTVQIAFPPSADVVTGDDQGSILIPARLNGQDLISVAAYVDTVSSSGEISIMIHNDTDAADMLSPNPLTIDVGENSSSTAAISADIDATADDVATDDVIRIDIDSAGTGAKGLTVTLTFNTP